MPVLVSSAVVIRTERRQRKWWETMRLENVTLKQWTTRLWYWSSVVMVSMPETRSSPKNRNEAENASRIFWKPWSIQCDKALLSVEEYAKEGGNDGKFLQVLRLPWGNHNGLLQWLDRRTNKYTSQITVTTMKSWKQWLVHFRQRSVRHQRNFLTVTLEDKILWM